MARYPGATWRPIYPEMGPVGSPGAEPRITPTCVVLHTAVSRGSSLFGYFGRDDVHVESHIYVPGDDYDVEQYIDSERQADAQFYGNAYALSAESWDNADPEHVPWTDLQLERLAHFCAWSHQTHQIPLVTAHLDGNVVRGIGYHSQPEFHDLWNLSDHSCPAAPRIAQVPKIIARAAEIAGGGGKPPPPPPPHRPALAVDGAYGPLTVKELQRQLNAAIGARLVVDGVPGYHTDSALQRYLNRKLSGPDLAVDGVATGYNLYTRYPRYGSYQSIRHLQRFLGTHQDGYFDKGDSAAVRALQRRLNGKRL